MFLRLCSTRTTFGLNKVRSRPTFSCQISPCDYTDHISHIFKPRDSPVSFCVVEFHTVTHREFCQSKLRKKALIKVATKL